MKKVTIGQMIFTTIAAGAAFIFGGKFLNKNSEENSKDNAGSNDGETNGEIIDLTPDEENSEDKTE